MNFLLPFAIMCAKKIVPVIIKKIVPVIIEEEVKDRIEKSLKAIFTEFCSNAIINVILLSFSVYVAPTFLDKDNVYFCVCSIYLASVLQGLYNFFKYFPYIWRYIWRYGGNLEKMIDDEISRNMSLFEEILDYVFDTKSTKVNAIIRIVFLFAFKQGLAMVIYLFIFRWIVQPWAVEDATGLNWYEALIYPFSMAFDYFFGFETQDLFIP